MSKLFQEHPEARALEDAAWKLKDLASDAHARTMSGPLRAALARAIRDTDRVYEALHAELHKRKRAKDDEQPDAEPVAPTAANGVDHPQQELGGARDDG
jgi:hypothetical protein